MDPLSPLLDLSGFGVTEGVPRILAILIAVLLSIGMDRLDATHLARSTSLLRVCGYILVGIKSKRVKKNKALRTNSTIKVSSVRSNIGILLLFHLFSF